MFPTASPHIPLIFTLCCLIFCFLFSFHKGTSLIYSPDVSISWASHIFPVDLSLPDFVSLVYGTRVGEQLNLPAVSLSFLIFKLHKYQTYCLAWRVHALSLTLLSHPTIPVKCHTKNPKVADECVVLLSLEEFALTFGSKSTADTLNYTDFRAILIFLSHLILEKK